MMTAEEIKVLVARSAKSPVHIHTTDGAMYLVNHPELVFVSRTLVVIGTGIDQPVTGIPERVAFVPIEQIARIETFPKAVA